jgi:hypothetical protein
MEKEASCNFEDVYYNMDGQSSEHHDKKLLHDQSSKMNSFSFYCNYIYNYIVRCFFPSHINSLYQ